MNSISDNSLAIRIWAAALPCRPISPDITPAAVCQVKFFLHQFDHYIVPAPILVMEELRVMLRKLSIRVVAVPLAEC